MKFTVVFLFLIGSVQAQEKYKWFSIENVTFYDLKNANCYEIDSIDKIPKESKAITYKKPRWEMILPIQSNVIRDIATETTCYVLVVKFKNGSIIPFRLYPNQKALYDMRKNHSNYFLLGSNVFKKFDDVLQLSIDCLNDPNCSQVR